MSTEYIGIDLHKRFFTVCAIGADGVSRWGEQWPTTPDGIRAFVMRCTAESHVVIEASGPTWSFADQVVGHVATLQVIDPRKTQLRAGYAAKTDRLDARRLADARRRDSVVPVYYPPVPIRQLRELCRYRATLVRMRTALKQRLHALLVRQGVVVPPRADLFGRRGRQWLTQVTLPGWAGESFTGFLQLYQQLDAQLAPIEAQVARVAAEDPVARALDRLPGVGAVLGLLIRAEIGSIRRFPRAAQLASYAGVVPRVTQSGGRCYHGRLTKAGSPWLRWALIEAATHGCRRPDAIGRWARQLAIRKGALKARAAIARRLCDEIFDVWAAIDTSPGPSSELL